MKAFRLKLPKMILKHWIRMGFDIWINYGCQVGILDGVELITWNITKNALDIKICEISILISFSKLQQLSLIWYLELEMSQFRKLSFFFTKVGNHFIHNHK